MLKVSFNNTFFQTKAVITNLLRKKQCLCDISKFICFANNLLHSIPQNADIEAKETDL